MVKEKHESRRQCNKKKTEKYLSNSFIQTAYVSLLYKKLDGFHAALELVLIGLLKCGESRKTAWDKRVNCNVAIQNR